VSTADNSRAKIHELRKSGRRQGQGKETGRTPREKEIDAVICSGRTKRKKLRKGNLRKKDHVPRVRTGREMTKRSRR